MINFCIITKDQSNDLKKCLSALLPLACNIIVCDTGSEDDSVQIAKSYTEYVYHFPWCDDFSVAKNYCVSMAPGDFVCVVDTDEFLLDNSSIDFYKNLLDNPTSIGQIKRLNYFSINGEERVNIEWVPRIYNRKFYHYEGSIHEQLVPIDGGSHPHKFFRSALSFNHGGYIQTPAERERKANRNISLLLKEIENLNNKFSITATTDLTTISPEKSDKLSYNYYQLGKGYYYKGDYIKASEAFSTGLSFDVNESLDYVSDMVETYGYSLINSNNIEEAAGLLNVYDSFCNSADFCFMIGLVLMNLGEFDAAVHQFEVATGFSESKVEGVNGYLAFYNAGVIMEVRGMLKEAREYYKKCGDYEKATARLKSL